MISFSLSLVLLLLGYFVYGRLVEHIFGVNSKRETPAIAHPDGVDFIPMKPWRIFLIQFLNIAGLGPIFGAIMGARFGTASFLWIVLGSIFGGAVHDYLSGMISLRRNGASLPELHGEHLGYGTRQFMRIFMTILMILVGVVFVDGPANILADLTPEFFSAIFWVVIIMIYYVIATLFPIDKIIGKIYPLFGICLLFMAIGILGYLIFNHPAVPEFWDGLGNKQNDPESAPIFPMMFVSIACGAVSGFHATQSPLMARCMVNEKQGRPIFYGAMITEGIVALIWAAAASVFFFSGDYDAQVAEYGSSAPKIIKFLTETWLGRIGSILALLGVVFAPITSGDTALRSARLIVADFLHIDQKPITKRLVVAVPIFIITALVLVWSLKNKESFNTIWNYFAWCNQVLAAFTLWTITIYLVKESKYKWAFIVSMIPAIFMTSVCSTFMLLATPKQGGFNFIEMSHSIGYASGVLITLLTIIFFFRWRTRYLNANK
ncbi:MAG: carbon starvation protein A [Bacteroidales bacterium]|nr:carbon starvation protein A [Bacteroidales bacterium]